MQTQTLEKYKPFVITLYTVRNVFAGQYVTNDAIAKPYML